MQEEDKGRRRRTAVQSAFIRDVMSAPPLSSEHIFANVKTGQNFQKVKKEEKLKFCDICVKIVPIPTAKNGCRPLDESP